MISELSAGCECIAIWYRPCYVWNWKCIRLHPKCSIPRQKIKKKFWGVGTAPSPIGEGNTPPQTLPHRRAWILGAYDARPAAPPLSSFAPPPPISQFWLRAWPVLSIVVNGVQLSSPDVQNHRPLCLCWRQAGQLLCLCLIIRADWVATSLLKVLVKTVSDVFSKF